jgi:hypothetical protein
MRHVLSLLGAFVLAARGGSDDQPDGPRFLDADVHAPCGKSASSVCNPLTQTGCNTGEKCTWFRVSEACGGEVGCAPAGDVPVGGSCTWGPDGALTGFDDCVLGAVCDDSAGAGSCLAMCSLADATLPCPASLDCVAREGLFSDGPTDVPLAGVCDSI